MQCVDLQVIATTPPTCYALEEPMSQSSSPGSGTHLSNVSGFSLGEAIVQRAKQDIEFCPLLQMNTDAGELMSATASHLLLTSSECTQTLEEIPTMEEGTITMTEETSPQGEFGQFQTPQRFEQQENILSPALALVTACSTQNGLSLSLLHRSSLEFASLRAAPDLSVASHEGSQAAFQANKLHQMPILEVSADCVKGSLSMSPSPSWDVSEAWVLSQHPLTPSTPGSETTEDEDFTRAQNYIRDQSFMELGCEFHGVSNSDLQSSLDLELSTCPCSQQRDFSCNSGHQTEENRHSSSQQSQMQQGAVICGTVVPELEAAGQQGCNSEPPQDLGDPVVSAVVVPDRGRTADEGDQTCPDASQETPSTGALPAFITTRAITSSTESFSCNNSKGDIAAEVLTSGSNGGREQVHEDRQSSPTACAGIDSYFTPPVAGPIYQSTPASMANKVLDPSGQCGGGGHPQPTAARLNGVPLVPAFVKLESSRASEKPSLLNNGRPMSAGTGRQSPVTERQSSLSAGPPLPPLSHMEKIQPDGAWRPGSQPSFNNLVLHGMRTISPCQCVNGSIADSLSHMLVQVSGMLTSDLQPTCSMVATLRDTPLLVDCLHSVRASDGPGNSSQLDSGRESPDHGPLCELDSSLRFEKDGAPSLERSASQPSCGASPLNPRPRLEKDSVDQSLSECHVISPGPDRTSPLGTDSVEDAIDPPTSSLDTSQAGEHTLTMSGHSLTSLEVDNCVPAWGPPSLTSESNLFNIDDRIPDDLRNLGINQAPSNILGSKGPLRGVELDLKELRNVRETVVEGFQAEEGWEGTKQSVWPPDPLSMLSEEDRRRIEEIKAELLQQSETSINSQVVGLEEAEDLSLASNNSGSVLSFTTPRSLDTARSQICSQLQGASDTTVEPQTPLQKNMEKLPEAVGVPRTDFPLPIATITFSSRRRPLSTSPFPSATLLKSPPTGHREPIGYTQLSAAEVPSEPEHGEQLAGKVILSPTKAAARTVLSHVRVTLSPNRPDIPNVCSADEPLSLCKPLLPASDSQAMAMDLAPRPSPPPKDSVLGSASPPYPPWPMPMPSLWPKCPPLFDHSSEAELPVTREPPSQTRILATQDANKVDVSTQTSGQAPSPPAAPAPSEAQLQDGQSRVERTLSIPALMTGGTAAVSGCTSTTDGPLMLPYKPAGSSRLFYMANARLRQRSDLVDSENGSELSQSGTRPHQGLLRAGTDSFKRLPIRDQRGGGPDPSSAHGHWRCPQQRQQDAAHQWTPASTTIRQAWPDLRGQWDDDWPDPHEQGKEDWSDPHEQRREDWSDPHEQGREDRSDLHEHGREDWSDPHEWGREDWSDPCVQLAEPSLTYKELAKVAVRSADAEGSPENGVPGPGDPQWWEGTEDLRCSADLRLPLQQGMERGPPQWNGADLRLSRQSVVDPKPPWWGGVEPISSWQGADPGPPQRSGAELSPSWRRAADLEPPQRSAADLRPAQQSVVDLGPLRRGAGDPGPPRRGAGDPGPPRRGAGDPGPPRRGAGDPGPPRRGAGDPGPPRRGAGDPGPPRRGAGDPGPPRRGAGDPGPPRRGAGDPGPPRRGAGDPGPPRRGAGDPGPPRRGAGDPGPPRRGAGDPGPPRRGAGDPGPPRRGAGDPGPPRRGAGDPGPPRRGAAVSGPLWQGSDCGRPWQGRADPGPSWQGGPLHQLWERLKERQHQQQSLGSSTDSELSLLERMHQLAQFLRAPVQAPTPSSSALLADVTINHILEHRRGARPSTSESETASIPSTIDTARLIRAFGPERVLPLACLYNTIQQQRESSAHRREQPQRGETRYPGTRTAQQADSVSPSTSDSTVAGRRCTRPPRGPSSRLVARKGARLVDQGVQAGSLEIVPGATRRKTRDVGVTFPSPDSDLAPHWVRRWDPSASLSSTPSNQLQAAGGRERRGKVGCPTGSRQGEGTRKPAVAWFVPAHELQGVGRKENVPEPRERLVEAWGLRKSGHMRRREPLRQIHLQGIWNPSPRGKSPSSLVPLTLREALGINRPWFISRSRERQRRLSLRTYERRFQNLLQSEREQLFNRPPAPGPRSRRGQRTDCSILYKKKISKQEMLDRSRRLYEQLPEVTRRRDEEKRRAESQTNRLRAQLYKQKITNHILGKKVSWQ
ncbi:uncharacterized protein [Narcine bancroftii]|uniref:uncharacterized protein isoform X5 n=1 Tax=Narcine bancroftii TaxID=1343680 RepID=UPI0038320B7D